MCYAYYSTQTTNGLFERAMIRGLWQRIRRKLKRQPTHLIDFNHKHQQTSSKDQSDRGIETIPIKQIVGSLGRVNEFDRDFMPLDDQVATRWKRMIQLYMLGVPLPPIEVYSVNSEYFVIDGNHRVSVSQFLGIEYVDAHVIELRYDTGQHE